MTTKELINQYVTAHADNRWMDASELETLLTEFAEKLKEPASEELEVAARRYVRPLNAIGIRTFKAGAQWQEEQMIKDAVEADIAESFTPVSESPDIYMHGFTCVYEEKESTPYVVAPCKVKLIIIKE